MSYPAILTTEKVDEPPTQRRRSGLVPVAPSCMEEGDAALRAGELDDATMHYQRALEACPDNDAALAAAAVYGLATVARLEGQADVALRYLEHCITCLPTHRAALHDLVHLCASIGRWDKVIETEQRLFDAISDERERCDELVASGDRWWQGARDRERALARFRQVLCIDRRHAPARARLKVLQDIPPVGRRTPVVPSDAPRAADKADNFVSMATPVCRVVPLGVMVDERVLADLDRLAERQKLTRAAIVTHALLSYLDKSSG